MPFYSFEWIGHWKSSVKRYMTTFAQCRLVLVFAALREHAVYLCYAVCSTLTLIPCAQWTSVPVTVTLESLLIGSALQGGHVASGPTGVVNESGGSGVVAALSPARETSLLSERTCHCCIIAGCDAAVFLDVLCPVLSFYVDFLSYFKLFYVVFLHFMLPCLSFSLTCPRSLFSAPPAIFPFAGRPCRRDAASRRPCPS